MATPQAWGPGHPHRPEANPLTSPHCWLSSATLLEAAFLAATLAVLEQALRYSSMAAWASRPPLPLPGFLHRGPSVPNDRCQPPGAPRADVPHGTVEATQEIECLKLGNSAPENRLWRTRPKVWFSWKPSTLRQSEQRRHFVCFIWLFEKNHWFVKCLDFWFCLSCVSFRDRQNIKLGRWEMGRTWEELRE